MINKQIEHLKGIKNREDEILNKQVTEAEEKASKMLEEKERRRRELKEQIERSRKQQIDKRTNDKEMTKKEEKEFAEFWKIRNDELAISEQQELEEFRQRQVELKGFIKKQSDIKNTKREEEFKSELLTSVKCQALLD